LLFTFTEAPCTRVELRDLAPVSPSRSLFGLTLDDVSEKEFFRNMISACAAGIEAKSDDMKCMMDSDDSLASEDYCSRVKEKKEKHDLHHFNYIETRGLQAAIAILNNKVGFNKSTALMIAAKSNNLNMLHKIGMFFAKNCPEKLDEQDNIGNTALLIAAENGHTRAVEKLVLLGASLLAENNYGMNALALAVQSDQLGTTSRLCDLAGDHLELRMVKVESVSREKDKEITVYNKGKWPSRSSEKKFKALQFSYNEDEIKRSGIPVLHVLKPEMRSAKTLKLDLSPALGKHTLLTVEGKELSGTDKPFKTTTKIRYFAVKNADGSGETRKSLLIDDTDTCIKIEDEKDDKGLVMRAGHRIISDSQVVELSETEYEFRVQFKNKTATDKKFNDFLWLTRSQILAFVGEFALPVVDAYIRTLEVKNSEDAKNGKLEIDQIIQRRYGKGEEGSTFEISWRDETRRPSWHSRDEIDSWGETAKQKCVAYCEKTDEIIRHFLNCRNKYSKSAFLNAVEFSKVRITAMFLNRKPWCTDKYLKKSLACSESNKKISAIMFGVSTGNVEVIQQLLDNDARPQDETGWGDNAFKWSSKNVLETQSEILHLMLSTLKKRFAGAVSSTERYNSIDSLLNSYKGQKAPSVANNCLMIAACAGNIANVKVLTEYGADEFNNGKETFHDENFKSAAHHAFEANHYEIAYLLDEAGTLEKLREQFRIRCEANFHIKYLNSTSPALGKRSFLFYVLISLSVCCVSLPVSLSLLPVQCL